MQCLLRQVFNCISQTCRYVHDEYFLITLSRLTMTLLVVLPYFLITLSRLTVTFLVVLPYFRISLNNIVFPMLWTPTNIRFIQLYSSALILKKGNISLVKNRSKAASVGSEPFYKFPLWYAIPLNTCTIFIYVDINYVVALFTKNSLNL